MSWYFNAAQWKVWVFLKNTINLWYHQSACTHHNSESELKSIVLFFFAISVFVLPLPIKYLIIWMSFTQDCSKIPLPPHRSCVKYSDIKQYMGIYLMCYLVNWICFSTWSIMSSTKPDYRNHLLFLFLCFS